MRKNEPRRRRSAQSAACHKAGNRQKISFWTYNNSGSTNFKGGAVSKHIFLGETRLATVINDYRNVEDRTFGTEKNHIYFYHSDHLGSAQLVTDHNGDEYRKLAEQYEANKTDGVDALERLKYGIFEFWFSANSYSNTDEFFINFFGNNLEATADMAQFDLDEINLWLQMKIINKEIERLKKVYENE